MEKNKFLSLLGLCRKAGKTMIGTPLVTKSLPSGQVQVVFVTCDASENTKKKVNDKTSFYKVKKEELQEISSEELAKAIGKSGAVCTLGITDVHFAKELISQNTEKTGD